VFKTQLPTKRAPATGPNSAVRSSVLVTSERGFIQKG
jgi:hypothetical protein